MKQAGLTDCTALQDHGMWNEYEEAQKDDNKYAEHENTRPVIILDHPDKEHGHESQSNDEKTHQITFVNYCFSHLHPRMPVISKIVPMTCSVRSACASS